MAGLLVVLGVAGVAGGAGGVAHAWAGSSWTGSSRSGSEADVAYHGRVALADGRLRILLVPQNDGPSALANATVRLRLSVDLADRQELAEGCVRAGLREVMCETGALPLHGRGRHIGLVLGLKERTSEVVMRVDTWWNGGATDRNRANNEHSVLALDTGDAYAF